MPRPVDKVADRSGHAAPLAFEKWKRRLMLSADAEAGERPIEAFKTAPADDR